MLLLRAEGVVLGVGRDDLDVGDAQAAHGLGQGDHLSFYLVAILATLVELPGVAVVLADFDGHQMSPLLTARSR